LTRMKSEMAEMTGSFHAKGQATSAEAEKMVREGETGKNYESGRMRRYAERLSDSSQKKQELTETDRKGCMRRTRKGRKRKSLAVGGRMLLF
jgi:hypothetical protein